MKRFTRLCIGLCILAIVGTTAHAGRPQCSPPFTPGPRICFTELAPFGYDWMVALAGSEDNYNTEGTTAIYLFASNDFIKYWPDGSLSTLFNDARADVLVCRDGGYDGCLFAWLATYDGVTYPPPPLPDMLVGTATVSSMGKIGPTAPGCPLTFQSRGVVTDMDVTSSTYGREFVLSAQHIRINTPGQEEGCTTLFQTVTLTPKR